jgi:hypothetical protein
MLSGLKAEIALGVTGGMTGEAERLYLTSDEETSAWTVMGFLDMFSILERMSSPVKPMSIWIP